jgi:hypothetical protein
LKIDSVPEELQAESLHSNADFSVLVTIMLTECSDLIIRILYRLRSLAEQTPFDASTFSYVFPLLEQIVQQGGIAVEEEDEPLEQVALTLDLIKFHCGECE